VKLAADVVAVLDALGIDEFVALGESLGGGVATLVDEARPGAMRRLMLCEAIAFDLSVIGRRPGSGDSGNLMATIARKRKPVWPDRATVRESYGSRPPLDAMAPEALDAYVRWGLHDRPDGQVELACPPDAEATLFEISAGAGGGQTAFAHLDALHAPVVVLHGDSSNLPGAWFRGQAERAGCPLIELPGGHFFVQEDTARAVGLVREHLA
jgi:pimeloyl-ACP methyl ester carboxylesterase